jgi:hypothetical protein
MDRERVRIGQSRCRTDAPRPRRPRSGRPQTLRQHHQLEHLFLGRSTGGQRAPHPCPEGQNRPLRRFATTLDAQGDRIRRISQHQDRRRGAEGCPAFEIGAGWRSRRETSAIEWCISHSGGQITFSPPRGSALLRSLGRAPPRRGRGRRSARGRSPLRRANGPAEPSRAPRPCRARCGRRSRHAES